MRNLIRYVYKGTSYLWIVLRSKIGTQFFHIKLWINGVQYGHGVRTSNVVPALQINKRSGKVMIGNNVSFNCYSNTGWYSNCKLFVREGGNLLIGDNSGVNGAMIFCVNNISIGKNVMIGGGTRIYDTDFHNLDYLKRRDPKTNGIAKTKPVVIEEDVFIGSNCIVGKGVTIGARSIVAAGSVVVKSIPPDSLAGGNPCKVIKTINNIDRTERQ